MIGSESVTMTLGLDDASDLEKNSKTEATLVGLFRHDGRLPQVTGRFVTSS